MQAKALKNEKGGWELIEHCLHIRDAHHKRLLLLLENAEVTQATGQAARVSDTSLHACKSCGCSTMACVVLPGAFSLVLCWLWVQELAEALKRLSKFRPLAAVLISRCPIPCADAAHISISALQAEPAVQLLREKCMTPAQLWEPELAQELAELCGRNALCLTTAGSLIHARRCTMKVRTGPACYPGGLRAQCILLHVRSRYCTCKPFAQVFKILLPVGTIGCLAVQKPPQRKYLKQTNSSALQEAVLIGRATTLGTGRKPGGVQTPSLSTGSGAGS